MPPTPTMTLLTPLRRTTTPSHLTNSTQQIRHASLLRRPKRPYTFTQMVTLSDGSTYLHRTTSPAPIVRSTKDTKNNPMWNPSSQKLANVEEDEAGRLKRFRGRFGRGWDAEVVTEAEEVPENEPKRKDQPEGESMLDLISGYGQQPKKKGEAAGAEESKAKSGKGKGGQK